jgi:hypothetical protein
MDKDIYNNGLKSSINVFETRQFLIENLARIGAHMEFKLNKSKLVLSKKEGKNYQKIYFQISDYTPLHIRLHFEWNIWDQTIEDIKNGFYVKTKTNLVQLATILIAMGDFIEEDIIKQQVDRWLNLEFDAVSNKYISKKNPKIIETLTRAQIAGFSFEIHNEKSLMHVAKEMEMILINKVFSMTRQLSTINGIDNFFSSKHNWSIESLMPTNMATELIAAQLNGKRNAKEVFVQLKSGIKRAISEGKLTKNTDAFITQLFDYIN